MKKFALLFGLFTTVACLTACGSKNFNMSFEEALKIANHSELQEILLNAENFEQNLNLSTNFANEWAKTSISLHSNSKQNIKDYKSESSTTFDVDIDSNDSKLNIDWGLDIKFVDNTIYLNLESLDITGSQDAAFLAAMVEWFKNQWFSIPMSGLDEMSGSISQMSDLKKLNEQAEEIFINEWFQVYSWKFDKLNGYNAYKISLDNEKLQKLIDEYYSFTEKADEATEEINNELEEAVEDAIEEAVEKLDTDEKDDKEVEDNDIDDTMDDTDTPKIDVQNFEWYLVITWKDKVATVIENMDIVVDEVSMNVKWFVGDDVQFDVVSEENNIMSLTATKKKLSYDIVLTLSDIIKLEWTLSPKLSTSDIAIKFDMNLTIKSEYEEVDDTVIPLKGSWTYNSISDFDVIAPENSQDLMEMIWGYLGGMMEMEADDSYEYDDYGYSDYNDINFDWDVL